MGMGISSQIAPLSVSAHNYTPTTYTPKQGHLAARVTRAFLIIQILCRGMNRRQLLQVCKQQQTASGIVLQLTVLTVFSVIEMFFASSTISDFYSKYHNASYNTVFGIIPCFRGLLYPGVVIPTPTSNLLHPRLTGKSFLLTYWSATARIQ